MVDSCCSVVPGAADGVWGYFWGRSELAATRPDRPRSLARWRRRGVGLQRAA